MEQQELFTAKQIGERIKKRRKELKLSMSALGKRVGVNKSTIQRYEMLGVDPKRTMVIHALADALLTTPEWLTGLSEEKQYSCYRLCQNELDEHVKRYLDTIEGALANEVYRQFLTSLLGDIIDLYTILSYHFAYAMAEIDRVAEDEGLKKSLIRYAIESGAIMERVYQKEMKAPVEDIKQFMDGILHCYDEGPDKVSSYELTQIISNAKARLAQEKQSRGSLTTEQPVNTDR